MKREDLKASFDQIGPSEADKKRMLNEILNRSEQRKGIHMTSFNIKKAIPALALAVVIAGSVLTYNFLNNGKGKGNVDAPEYVTGGDAAGRDDMAMPLLNEFQIGGRTYVLLADELRAEYGFQSEISESDIGSKIATIEKSPDSSLVGKEVYQYLPAGGEAIVAVKKDDGYLLHKFFYFDSYVNNQDEDASEYLKVYGINSADDIAKIQFIGHSEQSKLEGRTDIVGEITDRNGIGKFYDYYSVLKNSSDKYFEKLFGFKGYDYGEVPPSASVAPDGSVSEVDPVPPETNASMPNYLAPDYIGPDSTSAPAYTEPVAPAEDIARDDAAVSYDGITSSGGGTSPDAADPQGTAGDIAYDSIASDSIAYDNIASDGIIYGTTPVEPVSSGQTGITDQGSTGQGSAAVTGQGSTEPSLGSAGNVFDNSVTIRIYTKSGVYFDSEYYISFGFISRYEVSADFAEFMGSFIR